MYSLGSTTFRREDIGRGFEPDSSFYIGHIEPVRATLPAPLAAESVAFPEVSAAALSDLLNESLALDDTEWMDRVRACARRIPRRA